MAVAPVTPAAQTEAPSPTMRPVPTTGETPTQRVASATSTLSQATQLAIATIESRGPLCEGSPWAGGELSPNGLWITTQCDQSIAVGSVVDSRVWTLRFLDVYPWDDARGYREGGLFPFHWTKDNRYLFVSALLSVDGAHGYYRSGNGLLRLDIETGAVTEILAPEESAFDYYSFAFSPSERTFGYVFQSEKPIEVRLLDLPSAEKATFALPADYDGAGNLVWSPDEGGVVMSVQRTDGSFEIGLLSPSNGDLVFVACPDGAYLRPIRWLSANEVELSAPLEERTWVLNVVNHSIDQSGS